MSSNRGSDSEIEHKAFKALPRDPNQPEHRKPRAFIHRPDEDPEAAEEARRNATYTDAAKTIQLDDFSKVHQTPCVRNAFLPAIGGGLGIGALRFILGGSVMAACNFASGSFCGIAVVAYNWCQRRRRLEKDGIRKAVKVLDQKQALKDAKEKAQAPGAANASSQQGNSQGVSFWSTFKFW